MIKSTLFCHAATLPSASYMLKTEVHILQGGEMSIHYFLTGSLGQLFIPTPKPPAATDYLWEHTCFEAFFAVMGEKRYHEFNFSPSGQWAAFAFSDTRQRVQWTTEQAPVITVNRTPESMLLKARIPAVALPPNTAGKSLQLGLSGVLETQDGHRSYWALHHPAPHPDFHDRTGFTLTLNQP
ncbi:MAG: DOMON-like domain-containing protein [Methylococcaceae bacterium]|nr:DOMON-like domain-containing protein [Methylococcaceae bacterium]